MQRSVGVAGAQQAAWRCKGALALQGRAGAATVRWRCKGALALQGPSSLAPHLVGAWLVLHLLSVHLDRGEDRVVEADVDAHEREGDRVRLVGLERWEGWRRRRGEERAEAAEREGESERNEERRQEAGGAQGRSKRASERESARAKESGESLGEVYEGSTVKLQTACLEGWKRWRDGHPTIRERAIASKTGKLCKTGRALELKVSTLSQARELPLMLIKAYATASRLRLQAPGRVCARRHFRRFRVGSCEERTSRGEEMVSRAAESLQTQHDVRHRYSGQGRVLFSARKGDAAEA
eukprot:554454-Pleurochrysis_carterae.AAC.1